MNCNYCIGAFFVNFLVTTTLMSNPLELLRLFDIIRKKWALFRAVTDREIKEAHRKAAAPFAYGMEYAWYTPYSIFCILMICKGCYVYLPQ
jgi:hypothetical protein